MLFRSLLTTVGDIVGADGLRSRNGERIPVKVAFDINWKQVDIPVSKREVAISVSE